MSRDVDGKMVEGEVYGESLDDFGRENDLMS